MGIARKYAKGINMRACDNVTIFAQTLVCVDAPHFCAGAIAEGGVVVRAAPIIKWCRGWKLDALAAYCRKKGWAYNARSL